MSEYMNNDNGYELDWNSEIEKDGNDFVIAEPGDYSFTVVGFERARFNGSAKIPACNQAKLTIKLDMPDGSDCRVKHNLLLHSKVEWRLCEFFTAIGQRQKGQRLAPNWNALIGATGRCKVSKRKYTNRDGREMETNDIDKFYEPAQGQQGDVPFTMGNMVPGNAPQSQGYAAPQQGYAQQQYQTPQQQYQAPAGNGGYTPGLF